MPYRFFSTFKKRHLKIYVFSLTYIHCLRDKIFLQGKDYIFNHLIKTTQRIQELLWLWGPQVCCAHVRSPSLTQPLLLHPNTSVRCTPPQNPSPTFHKRLTSVCLCTRTIILKSIIKLLSSIYCIFHWTLLEENSTKPSTAFQQSSPFRKLQSMLWSV